MGDLILLNIESNFIIYIYIYIYIFTIIFNKYIFTIILRESFENLDFLPY